MRDLLDSFNLSENAISIYLKGLGGFPYTQSEIQNIIPNVSEKECKQIIDELIEKKLILLVNPKYSESIPHYIIIPPFAAMLNNITGLTDGSDNTSMDESEKNLIIERFQDALLQDLETISEDLVNTLSNKDNSTQTMEILSEVEENVKKFANVILTDVIGMISPLKLQSAVDARDFSKLITSVEQKISESEQMVANMFSQFRDIIKNIGSSDIPAEVEAFKTFIRRLGESIDKRVQELTLGAGTPSSEKIQALENSLYSLLTNFISKYEESTEKFWIINSYAKIKEILSVQLDKCTKEILILVPSIEDFLPLEKFDLDYTEDLELKMSIKSKKSSQKKTVRSGLSITKKQKKAVEEKIDLTAKKVAELKGFELSHDIADLLSLISEINAESVIIDNIQDWLNRLLVIRKHLDSNTQYILLESLEKWKKNYPKVKKVKKKPEEEVVNELKSKISEGKSTEGIQPIGLHIKIISSDSHDNKHALAFAKKANIKYLQLKNNHVIAMIGDGSSLIFGVYQKTGRKPPFEISGFYTTYKPIIEIIAPIIDEIQSKAQYPREIEINRGFNEIISNINDYPGIKMGKKLETLLNVVFEKDGISLDILELKLLIGKLSKLYQPLDNEMKDYVINELIKLNQKFSSLELIYPPEFKPPVSMDKTKGEFEGEIAHSPIKPLDLEKLDNLFELFLEKIEDLKGIEIGQQLDKFIDVILKLQGYENIIEWKDSLRDVDKPLEEAFKEKIKEDLLSWKLGILQQTKASPNPLKEQSIETQENITEQSPSSIFEEEYISPGLAQSQFGVEEETQSIDEGKKIDPKAEMKEIFNKIQANLDELNGIQISKLMQNILDIILETEGYSIDLKDLKDWIGKLRKIKGQLEYEVKDDFQVEFLKWKEKYADEDDDITLDFSPSYGAIEESTDMGESSAVGTLNDKFNELTQNAQTLKGDELSNELQSIADILLQSHGAVAVNVIRQWISKLRSIKEPLEDDIKDKFIAEVENWKEKFA